MKHMTSREKARIVAEVEARKEAAFAKMRERFDCEDCTKEETPGYTRIYRECDLHATG